MLLSVAAHQQPTASLEFARLNHQAYAARQAGKQEVLLSLLLRIEELLNDSPASLSALAAAYASAGDSPHSLAALSRFADLGEADDDLLASKDQRFSLLGHSPEYKGILQRMTQNKTPVNRAAMALTLSDPGILAEDIDFDPQSKTFLITSVLEKKIIRVPMEGGPASDFAASPSHWPMLAIKVDTRRGFVWATEVALDGFAAAPRSDWGQSAVLCFKLKTGALIQRIEGPPHSALGDMALAPAGDPIISDGGDGKLYRVVQGRLNLINERDFISPQTTAVLPDGTHLLVPDYDRGIANLDLKSGTVAWLNGRGPTAVALTGIDGLYCSGGSLLLTQNGTAPERVVRLQLDSTFTRILSKQIIERATPTLGDPTHGVVVADSFFYIANSGWNNLDDHGNLKPGSKLTPARIMRFQLR